MSILFWRNHCHNKSKYAYHARPLSQIFLWSGQWDFISVVIWKYHWCELDATATVKNIYIKHIFNILLHIFLLAYILCLERRHIVWPDTTSVFLMSLLLLMLIRAWICFLLATPLRLRRSRSSSSNSSLKSKEISRLSPCVDNNIFYILSWALASLCWWSILILLLCTMIATSTLKNNFVVTTKRMSSPLLDAFTLPF